MEVVTANAINFRKAIEIAPRYRMVKQVMTNLNTSSVTLLTGQSQLLEWKLPGSVPYNPYKSLVGYNESVAAPTAGSYNVLFEDVAAACQSVALSTASGVDLCNLQYANNYQKVTQRQHLSNEEYLNSDAYESIYPSNALGSANLHPVAQPYQAGNIFGGVVANPYDSVTNYLEPRHLTIGAQNAVVTQVKQLKLGQFKNTILGMDRDLFLPSDVYLRINVNANKLGFESTTANTFLPATCQPLTGAVTFSNIVLYLAVEQNLMICEDLRERFMKGGIKFQVPYTMAFRTSTNGAGPASSQIALNNGYGKSIRKICHSAFNNIETGNTAFDCSNWSGSKITSYGTYMDSKKLQDADLSCLQSTATSVGMDDWMSNKKFFKGTAVCNGGQYQQNWSATDTFAEPNTENSDVPEENIEDGYPLDAPVIWNFTGQATGALAFYTYVTFLRDVLIENSAAVVSIR